MKITFLVIGKTEEEYLAQGINTYEKRLKHYCNFEMVVIPAFKGGKQIQISELKKIEGELILKKISTSDFVVLLDENGLEYSSKTFSVFIQKKMNSGLKNIVFVIGGAYGFSEEVYKRANEKLALSPMTFSHQMVRLFFIEQLYRAFTILKNEKYHH